ncbi:VP1054 [Trabala vishnou gigantina nucleopolyhedrovirus]|uniref:VP1054 n=1 Tax=Trabala vishnou gigantina nucleopolyhedrovirus TaxID=2863583 RepID=UPI002481EBA1|nr:VP1054 [Trabala vishnou gigantina nucleopolyhedrovirus]QYC92695.1 VP1054 [Trabala vishnou gigantina nucleopolyhedrovirus]
MSSSTSSLVKLKQCVLEKSIPFKSIKRSKTAACQLHPLRANCRAIKRINDDNENDDHYHHYYIYHETALEIVYLNYEHVPYYMKLVCDSLDRGYYNNANEMYAYVRLVPLDDDETFYGIDEIGERQMIVLANVLKSIMDAFKQCSDSVVLFVNELQLDLVYSLFRAVVLPQRVITMPYSERANALHDDLKLVTVPTSEHAIVSQEIYRTFVMYNTILTMLLTQSNPFNDHAKNISVVFRNLGKCPNDKSRVKCCHLKYSGNAPGHVMCPPREIVKRIFHYAKWARTPNNYKRYYELIVKPSASQKRQVLTDAEAAARLSSINTFNHDLLNWYNFVYDFRNYFGLDV